MKRIIKKKLSNNTRGINLIALVITVIVLLILAGVSIGIIFDSDGLFKKASGSAGKYNESKAREALETVLMGQGSMEKYTNPRYSQDESILDNIILTNIENSKVQGDIAIVDGYAYELDRSVPKIGKYLGREEDLKIPDVSISTPELAENSRSATFTITAIEEKNGISKIEVLQYGQVVQKFDNYSNTTETITQPVTVKRNGKYTVKAYSNLTGSARIEVTGIVASVEFSPNEDETYKKAHSTTIMVNETGEGVKSLKYQWLSSASEPSEESFEGAQECTNGSTVTGSGENMNGAYFLWVLLETNSGKKNICGSGAFNFDNEGPTITLASNPESETSFTLTATANDNYSNISKYEFVIDGNIYTPDSIEDGKATYTWSGSGMFKGNASVTVLDSLENPSTITCDCRTLLHTWIVHAVVKDHNYQIRKLDIPNDHNHVTR